jgi:hypothetical protein
MERSTVLERGLDSMSERFQQNASHMGKLVEQMQRTLQGVRAAGGEQAIARHRQANPVQQPTGRPLHATCQPGAAARRQAGRCTPPASPAQQPAGRRATPPGAAANATARVAWPQVTRQAAAS